MADTVRHQIVAAIAATNNAELKAVLLLMLGVLEEIGTKIDNMRNDERGLREAVLNGHAEDHSAHHVWISERMASDCVVGCEWAANKKREEDEAAKTAKEDAKADKRTARDAFIRQVVTVVVGGLMGVLCTILMLK